MDVEASEQKRKKRGEGKVCEAEESINYVFSWMSVVYACWCAAHPCVLSACASTHNTHASAEHVLRCVLNTHIMSDT